MARNFKAAFISIITIGVVNYLMRVGQSVLP